MNTRLRIFYFAWLLWAIYGAYFHFAVKAPYSVSDVVQNAESLKNQEVDVGGYMLLGFEAGTLYPKGTTRSQMPQVDAIHIEFDGWLQSKLKRITAQGESIVRGRLEYTHLGGYGHMGLNKFRIVSPQVIKWPFPISSVLFLFNYLALPILPLLFMKWNRGQAT